MNRQRKHVESFIFLFLFLFFIGISFVLITLGAKVYQKIESSTKVHFNTRTPLSYIQMKIRQNDVIGGIQIKQLDNQQALVLTETIEEVDYETWIYVYGDYLREIYIQEGDAFEDTAGEKILPLRSMVYNLEPNGKLKILLENIEGEKIESCIVLQCIEREETP